MTTWEQIKASYWPEKKKWDGRYPYFYYILRPSSFPLTWLAAEAGLSANNVTLSCVFIGIFADAALIQGHFILGASLLSFFNLVDCVDGNLARMGRGLGKPGKFLDGIATLPYWTSYLALGVGLARFPDAFAQNYGAYVSPIALAALGGMTSVLRIGSELVASSFWYNLAELAQAQKQAPSSGTAPRKSITESLPYQVYVNLTETEAHDFMLIVCACFGFAGGFLTYSAAVCALRFCLTAGYFVRRACSLGKKL